jgi:hypothetical protein
MLLLLAALLAAPAASARPLRPEDVFALKEVIYPGQNHRIRRPSYVQDRYQRYIAWYDRFLRPS